MQTFICYPCPAFQWPPFYALSVHLPRISSNLVQYRLFLRSKLVKKDLKAENSHALLSIAQNNKIADRYPHNVIAITENFKRAAVRLLS